MPPKTGTCDEPYIRADKLEDLVWTKLVENIRDPRVLIADLVHHLYTGEGDLGDRMAKLRREIGELKEQRRSLIELRQRDMIDLDLLEGQLAPVKILCDGKEKDLHVLEEQQRGQDDADQAGQRIAEYCARLAQALDDLDFDAKRSTLNAFGVNVEAARTQLAIPVSVESNVATTARTSA